MPIDIMYGAPTPPTSSPAECADTLRRHLELAYQRVWVQLGHQLGCQKELYDQTAHSKLYKRGEMVWLHTPVIPKGQLKKLRHPWTGPFRVVNMLSEAVYRIQNVHSPRQQLVVHFDRLKLCPPDMRISIAISPAPRPVEFTSASPDQPPGTTLQVVDNADADASSFSRQQRQHSPHSSL